jgi:hypothetical protein
MFSSYMMNAACSGYNRAIFPCLQLSHMPPNGVVFMETDRRYPYRFNDGANSPDEGISVFHNNGGVAANFDGSVEYWKSESWDLLANVDPQQKNRLWCYPDSPDGH